MVAEFVQRALMAAGVQCVEREPGLLRVYAHPLLAELVSGEPWVELVCDEALMAEHPGAMLCVPGSFPLDRILALVQEMPRAFRFRAGGELPADPPPGAPGVANAAAALRAHGTQERTAYRLLVRIRLQSDETVEHLEWVAADATGRERPDLLTHWDDVGRDGIPDAVAALEAVGLPVLETQAEAVAARLGATCFQAASAHREQERERLERFRRSMAEEIPAQLPSGPARRLAQGRAQMQALLDLLRGSLPGAGPWRKQELLAHGWWPFRRPGILPPLPLEKRLRFLRLLPHLPAGFGWPDLETAAREEGAPRLARLEAQVRADPVSAAQLAAAEQRLQEEHEGRMADLERKLQLRTLVTPRVLEELRYAAAAFDLRIERGPSLTVCWDPLAGAWEAIECPTCALPSARLWLCGNRTVGCDACASRCSGCERVEPRAAPLHHCALCEAPACERCGSACEDCGGWNCGRHVSRCAACETARCARCGASCGLCGGAACAVHAEICGVCRKGLCREHQARCVACNAVVCPEDRDRCAICAEECCAPHQAECRLCRQSYCARCVPGGTCETCRNPEPAAAAAEAALRSQLAALLPELDLSRLRGWTLARNNRCRVITARQWPWGHRFVLDEESGALLEYSRFRQPL